MSHEQASDVNGLGEWFWSRGVSFLIRALSLHGLSGGFLLLGGEATGTHVDADEDAEQAARDSMSGTELASATSLAESDDEAYEPTPVVIPLRRPLAALNPVAW